MRNVILVLGMHRSGTSAAAGLLVKLGGAQPKTLIPADDGNERGYFESQALMIFHDELLASAGSSWADWRQFNPAWYQSPTAAAFRKRAKLLFKEEFEGEPLAVLKDPRVCRFAPFWLKVLAGIKARARVVIPVRAPLEVAFSMRKRDGFSLATGAVLWLRHIIDAEIASRALPRSIFTCDQLLRDWRGVAEKASTELGLPWPRLSDATAHEIENFIGDDLVHHRVSAPELAAHPDMHEWTMSAYDAMRGLAHAPRSSSALKTLDEIRDAFNRASTMFGRTVLEDEIRSQDLLRTTAKLAEERDHWSCQHDAARAELAAALQAKEQISMELNARAREASDLAQALAEQGCQREQVELALARENASNEQLTNELRDRTAELAQTCAELEKLRARQGAILPGGRYSNAVRRSGVTLGEFEQIVDFDRNCSVQALQEHSLNLGLSPDAIDNVDIEQPLHRLFTGDFASDPTLEAEALLDVIQNVRQARRFDLVGLCERLQSRSLDDGRVTIEFILLYIDAEDWVRLRRFLEQRPGIAISLDASTILQLVPTLESRSLEKLELWPNEALGYAAKTAIFNVSNLVITRQRSLIEKLLTYIASQTTGR